MNNTIIKEGRPLQQKELRSLKRVIYDGGSAHADHPELTMDIIESVDVIEVDFVGVGCGFLAGIAVQHGFAVTLLENSDAPIYLGYLFQDKETGNWHLGLEVQFARV